MLELDLGNRKLWVAAQYVLSITPGAPEGTCIVVIAHGAAGGAPYQVGGVKESAESLAGRINAILGR
jgi:hypothetical protein